MPRFYFNIHRRGRAIADFEGVELPDIDAAIEEAQAAAREMIAEGVKANRPLVLGYAFEIADEAGTVLRTVKFTESLHNDFIVLLQRGSIH
jgi:hypothetical protein